MCWFHPQFSFEVFLQYTPITSMHKKETNKKLLAQM